ncbi:DUF3343 domain-containing protein [Schnuerera sp. xch1]|uniref:DUF3343 domain-containing protein n=1 Tax=Schnuerera sp. xch1 TaxID=2874283 RepID=UPI001CBF58FB|nr:DUF3343 domain-containing protein [Schnuerera sp. xch1]MBZ2175397.1 DUF3343 domain-containing protein [Schnuerera sp. xch1]
MKERQFGVVAFKSTQYAIKADTIFNRHNIKYRTIPTPREITHSCGLAIKFNLDDIKEVGNIIEDNHLETEGIFKIIKDNEGNKAEKLH